LVPKVGPFKAIAFKAPSTQTEDMYLKSLDRTLARYKNEISQAGENSLQLENLNFDTGKPTHAADYQLTDDSYAFLVDKIAGRHFDILTPALRDNILDYYGNLQQPIDTKRHKEEWAKLQQQLQELKQAPMAPPESASAEPIESHPHR